MAQFMLLHHGFEMPTEEIMQAWNDWFAEIADKTIDKGAHFPHGKEINKSGTEEMPFGPDSLTGYTIIEAADWAEAEAIASRNPFIKSIKIYEMRR
ncbi:MAG: YciI family protein [Candidatus Puniceispirillaceae bacterium]